MTAGALRLRPRCLRRRRGLLIGDDSAEFKFAEMDDVYVQLDSLVPVPEEGGLFPASSFVGIESLGDIFPRLLIFGQWGLFWENA